MGWPHFGTRYADDVCMAEDKMQQQRFELKYLINEDVARAARDFVSSYLEIDEYGATLKDFSYPVHSLYLDSESLHLYQTTINGDKNRYKLRLRYYDNRPDAPWIFSVPRATVVLPEYALSAVKTSVPGPVFVNG